MYTLYTDKLKVFECDIALKGAKLTDSKARIILESNDCNLIFYGTIDSSGKCNIPIKKLKSLMEENTTGNMKLEVIAEDTYFEPWNDTFIIETDKKLTVEVKSDKPKNTPIIETKKTIQVNVKDSTINNYNKLVEQEVLTVFKKRNITLSNLNKNKKLLKAIGEAVTKKYKLTESQVNTLVNNIVKQLV